MNIDLLAEVLSARLGFDVETVGRSYLKTLAKRTLEESGLTDLESFVEALSSDGEAWRILLDQALVSETWFFRDRVPFEHVTGIVRRTWRGSGTAPVRMLSCPCSTGEEAYSIAIAADAAGLPPDACAIDAADLSVGALDAARAGVFGPRSFREDMPLDRTRYFDQRPGERVWRIKPAYRSMVQFRPANLISGSGLQHLGLYDVIFCRNVLIYLHAHARALVMATLRRLLAPGGVLVVGHAEAGIAREHGFRRDGKSGAFAFVECDQPVALAADASPRRSYASARTLPVAGAASRLRPAPRGRTPSADVDPVLTGAEVTLQQIRDLGDAGRNQDAILACRAYLRRVPDSADAYFLLGLLCGAIGHDEAAATALRRALYLEPDHAAALVHLALAGEAAGAAGGQRCHVARRRSRRSGK